MVFFFFQAEDGIRDLVRSRGLGDVYKRQAQGGRQGLDIVHAALQAGHVARIAIDTNEIGEDLSLIHI